MIGRLSRRVILVIYSILVVVPLLVVIFGSFKSTGEIFSHPFSVPLSPRFSNYSKAVDVGSLGIAFANSAIVTVGSVLLTLALATLTAYAVARIPGWKGWLLFGFIVLGMSVPPQINMIQQYVLLGSLNLLDSRLGVILINVVMTLPVAVFIIGGFMRTIPESLYEAAALDGAGAWGLYRRIALPLSVPAVAATTTFLFVIVWNDLLYPLLFLKSRDLMTLPLALLRFQGEFQTNYPLLFTGVILSSIPMVVAYIFLQRYFVAGVTAGAIKG